MLKIDRIVALIFAIFLLSLATEQRLMAYADPGSGAMFVQIAVAAILGCLFRIRSFINRFRRQKSHRGAAAFVPFRDGGLTPPSK
jgi:hypothetical protein